MGAIREIGGAVAQRRDSLLARNAQSGDKKAFEKLLVLYKKRIFALGMGFFRNEADTEDFVQDVFIKAYQNLGQFRGDSLFSTWLTRIAYTTAVNAVNRRKEFLPVANEEALVSAMRTPEEEQIQQATIESVREAVRELPERYALCLEMYFFYDIPYKQIEQITEIPENTIKSHIFRAKKILREKLKELYANE